MINDLRPSNQRVDASSLTKLSPQFEFRDCVSPRVLDLPDGRKFMIYLHDWYWAALDYIDQGYEGGGQEVIKDAWKHADILTRDYEYAYIEEVLHWTLPFEIRYISALTQGMKHKAANQFLAGIYDFMENFLHQVQWPAPDCYRRIITDGDIYDAIASK